MKDHDVYLADSAGKGASSTPEVALPESAFEALHVAAGMLLGEADFQAILGHPRGKLMLHHSWLHGSGVVWGLGVAYDPELGLSVSPGLAVDGWGRELRLEWTQHHELTGWLTQWCKEHPASGPTGPKPERRVVRAWAVLEYHACPERKVPALADPCDVTRGHDAYSRVVERARVRIVDERPGPPAGFHRVRVLLGLEEPSGEAGYEARKALEEVLTKPVHLRSRELLVSLRRMAAKDVTDLRPAPLKGVVGGFGLHPVPISRSPVVLAALTIDVVTDEPCVSVGNVQSDPWVRGALIPTATIQELACGLAPGLLGLGAQDAGGPRLKGGLNWSHKHRRLHFALTAPAAPGSQEEAVELSSLSGHGRGWSRDQIREIRLEDDGERVVVELDREPAYDTVRVVVRGTGPTPLVGMKGHVPFAGRVGGPPGTADEGHDAVIVEHLGRNDKGWGEVR